jgi:hypothetical protein
MSSAQLWRMHWPPPRLDWRRIRRAVDGAPVEELAVFSFEQISVA